MSYYLVVAITLSFVENSPRTVLAIWLGCDKTVQRASFGRVASYRAGGCDRRFRGFMSRCPEGASSVAAGHAIFASQRRLAAAVFF